MYKCAKVTSGDTWSVDILVCWTRLKSQVEDPAVTKREGWSEGPFEIGKSLEWAVCPFVRA